MSPELEKQIVSLVEAAKQSGSDLASFVQHQAPELVEQIILRETVVSSAGCVVGGVLLVIGLVCLLKSKYDDDFGIAGMMSSAPGLVLTCINGYNLICVLTAPKLVVISEISALLK